MATILGFVGPSGSGKTTLMLELLARFPERFATVKSLTSRPRRGPEDDLFYDFLSKEEIRKRESEGRLVQVIEFSGNLYAVDKPSTFEQLKERVGLMAIVEPAIHYYRDAGFEMVIIKVIPEGQTEFRDEARQKADEERAKFSIDLDFELTNSFKEGGKEEALEVLTGFLIAKELL